MIEIIEPDFIFRDDRGEIVQLKNGTYRQVSCISSSAGTLRGGHKHMMSDETFYIISGSFLLTVTKEGRDEEYRFSKSDTFIIPKGVYHVFSFEADTVMLEMHDFPVEQEDGSLDIVREK